MQVRALGYVGLTVADPDEWRIFATEMMGMQAVPWHDEGRQELALRLDEHAHRFLLRKADGDGDKPFVGFELADSAAFEAAREEFGRAGITTVAATDEEIASRKVAGMFHVVDPSGYRIELFHGLAKAAEPFEAGWPMAGFRTGDLGIGHAVLFAPNFEQSREFYIDLLGFRLSDYLNHPTRRLFLHCNGRHHSLALSERAGQGIAHLMVEVKELDDLGRAYDLAQERFPDRIYSTLGRHANDHALSFYLKTPSGFPMEYGWGGQLVDDRTWKPRELVGPSLWGHERLGAPAAVREAANAQRAEAGRLGLRAPVQAVRGGSFDLSLVTP